MKVIDRVKKVHVLVCCSKRVERDIMLLFEMESEQVVIYEVWLLIILKFVENVL